MSFKIVRTLVRVSPVVIMAARKAWPYIAKAIQENPQLTQNVKNQLAAFSGKHRKATVEDIELRIAALREHLATMPEEPGALVVPGEGGVSRAEALHRLDQIDSSVHALGALTEKAQPAALRRISYELDYLATQVLVPKH